MDTKQPWRDVAVRRAALIKLKKAVIERTPEIEQALHQDFGKPHFETYASEIVVVLQELDYFIGQVVSLSRKRKQPSTVLNFPSSAYIEPVPRGDVLIISPWNYPFQLAVSPLIGAVAAGNRVVLKPSEKTKHTSLLLAKLLRDVFDVDWVRVITGGKEVAQRLLEQRWDYIFFTGSTKVGRIIAEAAAPKLIPITLELGGKNPCIVLPDAKIKLAAKRIAWAKFLNAGQTCIAPDYVVVHERVKDKLVAELKKQIYAFYGDDVQASPDFARLIDHEAWERVRGYLDQGSIACGGETDEATRYIAPTLLDNPSLKADVMQEEIFGPVLPIVSYREKHELEQIISVDKTPLAAYVFTENSSMANEILAGINSGGAAVNDCMIQFLNKRLPFGGIGTSGLGNYHGEHSFNTFSHFRSVVRRGTFVEIPLRFAPYKYKQKWLRCVNRLLS